MRIIVIRFNFLRRLAININCIVRKKNTSLAIIKDKAKLDQVSYTMIWIEDK